MRKQLLCVLVAAFALSLLGGIAPAATIKQQNGLVFETVSTGPTTVQYQGKVDAPAKVCRNKRKVDIYVGGVPFATVTTSSGGHFGVDGVKPPPGTQATAALRKVVKKHMGKRHYCPGKVETKKVEQ